MSSGHNSLGSGLDLHSASNDLLFAGGKMRGRKPASSTSSSNNKHHRSFGSGLDLHNASDDDLGEGSLHVADLLSGGKGSSNKKKTNDRGNGRLNRSMGDIAFKASDLGSLLAQQKELKRRGGGLGGASMTSVSLIGPDEEQTPVDDDIFTTYSWSSSRQPRAKVLVERKLLCETLRQGTFLAAYEAYVGKN